ncbi:MAG: hypothetical protein E7610_01805 [Ruminococcaceae bacterium]|nr:hypothetical protein [Oscillospiraceae bacterium]
MESFRNLAHACGLGEDPELFRLLRACGIDEAYITGGGSDYDKFLALAQTLPLCKGHAMRERTEAVLKRELGGEAVLCPHTAESLWKAWNERYWYGRDSSIVSCPAACEACKEAYPVVRHRNELIQLPAPTEVKGMDLQAWSSLLADALLSSDGDAYLAVPVGYGFVRPDPYHAGIAVRKISEGEVLTSQEEYLIFAQALRVWGQTVLQYSKGRELFLRGGEPGAVTALLAYLNTAGVLPSIVWLPDDPVEAGALSGLYATVRTGVDLSVIATDEERRYLLDAYATVAPLGRAVVLDSRII